MNDVSLSTLYVAFVVSFVIKVMKVRYKTHQTSRCYVRSFRLITDETKQKRNISAGEMY